MKPPAFDYVRAESLAEALAALAEGGPDAKPIAGGQSLVPALNLRLVRPSLLVDLNRAGLDGVSANGMLRVGATTRQAALSRDDRVHPLVRSALPFVGHFVTRNRGTVGGSIAHADGAAELPLCLVALDGLVVVDGPDGRREIPGRTSSSRTSRRRSAPGSSWSRPSGRSARRRKPARSRSSPSARGTSRSRWSPWCSGATGRGRCRAPPSRSAR